MSSHDDLRFVEFLGRRCRLTLHEGILLLCHEGAHSSALDPLAKTLQNAWWPSFEKDLRGWTSRLTVCRQLQAGSTFGQRHEFTTDPSECSLSAQIASTLVLLGRRRKTRTFWCSCRSRRFFFDLWFHGDPSLGVRCSSCVYSCIDCSSVGSIR